MPPGLKRFFGVALTLALPGGLAADGLKPMLAIRWEKSVDPPQGFQDSAGGVIDGRLITVAGFCSGHQLSNWVGSSFYGQIVPGKAGKYPRGFLQKVWGLDLADRDPGWERLPDFPGAARQALSGIVVDHRLYCWGGFSYTAPFCYRDGYSLSHTGGQWRWQPLPPLPWPVCAAGVCAIGSRIYIAGGADYGHPAFSTQGDRRGQVPRLGARLLTLDTRNLAAGWKQLTSCPGTPRWVGAAAAIAGKLYLIGGASGIDNVSGAVCTVVDNWCYDPSRDRWGRLPDTPIATGNFPAGAVTFEDRYILLIGGYQYRRVLNPDGTVRAHFGRVFKHYPADDYESDVLVYDTATNTFGRADPLPLNNNMPMAVVRGNELHLIGGETGGSRIGGEFFGHHPDLYLVGHLTALGGDDRPAALALVPPMGWNSWNRFHLGVSDALVRSQARAMVASGMRKAGYRYIVIDGGWEGFHDAQGVFHPNPAAFPDMKGLCDYLHGLGLKVGLHTSPGPVTCAGREASYGHEEQDARTFAGWGIDFVKYDWCSGARVYRADEMPAAYRKMSRALRRTGRPILFSLSQYGLQDVWKWGASAGGQMWRISGDLLDNYFQMLSIGFSEDGLESYAGPGHWNDPDMLQIGNGGMTDDEDRTHMALWCMLAAPLFAGNDLTRMSPATLATLTNPEVIAVDQDPAGIQGHRALQDGPAEIWMKSLSDGTVALGVFNVSRYPRTVTVDFERLGLPENMRVRDLSARRDRGEVQGSLAVSLPPHGSVLWKVTPN